MNNNTLYNKSKNKEKSVKSNDKTLIESYKKELIGGADCQISDYFQVYD